MRAPVPASNELRCPACRGALATAPCADPLAKCLSCSAGHRFFLAPESQAADTARAPSLRFPHLDGQPPRTVAAFWLSDPSARSALNEQLAELLRAILEDRRVAAAPEFSYCPLCGEALSEHEQSDVWMVSLRCPNAHDWDSRGGRLFGVVGGSRFTLHAEAPDSTIARLVAGWLGGNPHLEPQLNESVRQVLKGSRFAPRSDER
jgi:hypothetical protein